MARCANPRCGRVVRMHPVVVTVAGATLIYGPACARKLGLTAPRRQAAVANPCVSRRTHANRERRIGVQRQPAAAEAAQLDLLDALSTSDREAAG